MGLFDQLPAPKRPAEFEAEDLSHGKAPRLGAAPASAAAHLAEPSAADLEDLDESGPPLEAATVQAAGAEPAAADDLPPPPPPPPPPPEAPGSGGAGDDQVSAALRKIAAHIGQPKKFGKASALLRELLAQFPPKGAVTVKHGPLLFSALKASMADPSAAAEPLAAREYLKLFSAASKAAQVFSVREKNQLDVYGVWAVLRNQLNTDDSFQFNKVVARLKDMAAQLPEATEDDETVAGRLATAAANPDPVLAAFDDRAAEAAAAAVVAASGGAAAGPQQASAPPPAADAEADPFGLDALLEQQEAVEAAKQAAAAKHPKSLTWSGVEVACQRRAALLDCLETAKACYRHAWARTSIDLLIEHCHSHRHRFLAAQQQQLDSLMAFVRDQRRVRRLGPSAKELSRDTTSFERARAEWSRADVSCRGKVGGGGDRGAEQWLG